MKNLIIKEFKLSASLLTYLFLSFSLMAFIPNYPITLAGFFICFGIFHTFQSSRENNDVIYSALLPIKKSDIVKAKYLFVVVIQTIAFILLLAFTIIRMAFLSSIVPFDNQSLLVANFVYLAYILIIYGLFNVLFMPSFYKTAYNFGKPFVIFITACFITIVLAEVIHYIPNLEFTNSLGFENLIKQLICLFVGIIAFVLLTFIGYTKSKKNFNKVNL